MIKPKFPVITVFTFIWIGFVCAISFMEAPLKFQAPGITLPIGLGIGRLVFNTMNKIEWMFAVIIITTIFSFIIPSNENKQVKKYSAFALFLIPFSILIIQSSWLLPALDERAEMIIKGINPNPSNIHYYYVFAEFIKIISLFSFGISQFI